MGNKIRYAFGYMIGYVRGYIHAKRKRWAALLFIFKHCSSDEINNFVKELEKLNTKIQCIEAGRKANGIVKEARAALDDCGEEIVQLYNNYTGRYGKIFL